MYGVCKNDNQANKDREDIHSVYKIMEFTQSVEWTDITGDHTVLDDLMHHEEYKITDVPVQYNLRFKTYKTF